MPDSLPPLSPPPTAQDALARRRAVTEQRLLDGSIPRLGPLADRRVVQRWHASAQAALARRRAIVEQRLLDAQMARRARKADPRSYPPDLPYLALAPEQRRERREVAEDLIHMLAWWLRSDLLSAQQRRFAHALRDALDNSGGQYAISPTEWEAFWALRDFMELPTT